jgi:hypothetical protein
MTPFEQALRELGFIEKPQPKPKVVSASETPTDPWWKRGEECPH